MASTEPSATPCRPNFRSCGRPATPRRSPDEVAEALFAWDTATMIGRDDHIEQLVKVGDPTGESTAGLLVRHRRLPAHGGLPGRDLAQYETRQWLTIDSVTTPTKWAEAEAQAGDALLPGTTARTIHGVRHRAGVWDGEPVSSAVRRRLHRLHRLRAVVPRVPPAPAVGARQAAGLTMVKVVVAGLVTVLFAPAALMLGLAALLNPAAQAECLPSSPVVEQTPDTLTAARSDGVQVTLSQAQLTRAATIVSVGAGTKGVGRDGIVIALMAALTESSLRMLSNTSAYPESANYPNDGNGGDHDSLGLFQMRPSTGWGSVENLMDAEYQAEAFYGGPSGPNHGSPRGLLDIPDWKLLPKGAAAQAVEVSAYPDRYAAYEPVAEAILDAMATGTSTGSCGDDGRTRARVCRCHPDSRERSSPRRRRRSASRTSGVAAPTPDRPGVGSDGRGPGFDCSGLVMYAAYQASGGKLKLPHYSGAQITFGQSVAWDDKQPGDLIFFTHPGASAPHHVAIYVGDGKILQAPRTGENVRYGTVSEFAGETMTVRRLGG